MVTSKLWLYGLLTRWIPETRCFGLKAALLRWCGAKVGRNVRVNSTAVFLGNGRLEIGEDVWIGAGCRILPVGDATIRIGANCDVGPEVMILTGGHEIDLTGNHIGGKGKAASVSIGDGSWLCARSTILPGVTLSSKTLVAAGSVVTKSVCTEKSLVAGTPAKVKKVYA